MKLLHVVVAAILLLVGLRTVPAAFAQDATEHPIIAIICHPLPPAAGTQVAKALADKLQDLSACPAGQFPMRYGSGKDLPATETCVPYQGDFTLKYTGPIRTVDEAASLVAEFTKVRPCPPGQFWKELESGEPERKGGGVRIDKTPSSNLIQQLPGSRNRIEQVVTPAPPSPCPLTPTDNEYRCYVEMDQDFPGGVLGVSAELTAQKPYVPKEMRGHSLGQIALSSTVNASTGDDLDTVEMGWRVSSQGDLNSHLFTYESSRNYLDGCYNTCAGLFESNHSSQIQVGQTLIVGKSYTFEIIHQGGDQAGWHFSVDHVDIGYYHDSLWPFTFTQGTKGSWFGEVASHVSTPTSAMGSGRFGDDTGSASIASMIYYDLSGEHDAVATPAPADSSVYDIGSHGENFFSYGGPGWGSLSAYVPNFSTVVAKPFINLMQVGAGGFDFRPVTLPDAPNGWYIPGAVAVSPDGSTVYVAAIVCDANLPVFCLTSPTVLVFDTDVTGIPHLNTFFPIAGEVNAIAISPDGSIAYLLVAGSADSSIYEITKSQAPPAAAPSYALKGSPVQLDSANTSPSGIVASSDGLYLYVGGPNEVSRVRLTSTADPNNCVRSVIRIPQSGGSNGNSVTVEALSPDQRNLYTSTNIIDLTQLCRGNPLLPGLPVNGMVAITPDSRTAFVVPPVAQSYSSSISSNVFVFDVSNLSARPNFPIVKKTATIPLPNGPFPTGVSMSTDGSTLFVATSCYDAGSVTSPMPSCVNATLVQIDTQTLHPGSLSFPGSQPSGLAFHPGGPPSAIIGNFSGGR